MNAHSDLATPDRDASTRAPRIPTDLPPVFSARFVQDPEPTLAWLRAHAPLYVEPFSRMLVLTRHRDCAAALRDPGLSAAGGQQERTRHSGAPTTMLNTDGAEHASLRRPASALLGPPAVAHLTPLIDRAVVGILRAAPDGAPVDVHRRLSEPIATAVMAALFDIEDDARLAELDSHARAVSTTLDPVPSARAAETGRRAMREFSTFLDTEVLPRARPGTPLGALLADRSIGDEQRRGILSLCLVGGWVPVAELMTSAIFLTCTDPDVARTLQDADRAGSVIEELLRWHTPIPFLARRASCPVALPSGVVPAGALVLVHVGAANRDDEAYPQAASFRTRDGSPRHLALGAGVHYCLGAPLVRATLPLACHRLVTGYRLGGSTPGTAPRWRPSLFPRGMTSLEVVLQARRPPGGGRA